MREIKFRAWDEGNKTMHKDVEFIRSGIEENDWIVFKSDKQTLENSQVFSNPYFQQQIKLMQYTGLKDKNGVEIYEGDIVKIGINFGYGIESLFGEVIFKDCTFIYRNKSQGDTSLFGIDSNSLCEVVGNIYENPELLKD